MKWFHFDLDITPSIFPPYSSKFPVARNSNMDHVLPLKFHKIFLSGLNSNFRVMRVFKKTFPVPSVGKVSWHIVVYILSE